MKKLITIILLSLSLSATALPPEMEADRYLLQMEQAIKGKNKDYNQAIVIMDKIMALKDKHKLNLPIEFYYKYAKIILKSNDPATGSKANKAINHYLTTTGKKGKYYREALTIHTQSEKEIARQAEIKANPPRTNNIGMKFTYIPAGSFQMGDINDGGDSDEKPVHPVNIKEFYMGTTEVTQAQWQTVMGNNPSTFEGNDHPVESVSWDDIQDFIKKLNHQTYKQHRLPSEAEWEYAARAGSTTKYSWGDYIDHSRANYGTDKCCGSLASGKDRWKKTAPVAQFAPNAWELYDMHGNVFEWVEDCWNGDYNGAPSNGSAWESGNCARRVFRGGAWNNNPAGLRSANRKSLEALFHVSNSGFRLVQDRNHKKTAARQKAQRIKIIDSIKFARIPAGSFQMGDVNGGGDSDEKPVHRVSIEEFYMGTTEVTQAQWQAVMGNNPSYFKGNNRPVEKVSWNNIQHFIKKLNQQTGKQHRLPSEAEWEYAARAGSTTNYSWGNEIGNNRANCGSCGSEWDGETTAPAAQFAPNAWGLYDMQGNVWEWVEDCWNDDYNGAPSNGSAWESGDCAVRVLRGGSWYNNPTGLRSAVRTLNTASNRNYDLGFRLVQDR